MSRVTGAEGTAKAQALRQTRTWHVQKTARSEQGRKLIGDEVRRHNGARSLEP